MSDFEKTQLSLGKRLKERRTSLGWTQEYAAVQIGIDVKAYGRIETGNANVTLATLLRLANGFGVNIGELFEMNERPSGAEVAELHKLVDDAAPSLRTLMLHLFRAAKAWESMKK